MPDTDFAELMRTTVEAILTPICATVQVTKQNIPSADGRLFACVDCSNSSIQDVTITVPCEVRFLGESDTLCRQAADAVYNALRNVRFSAPTVYNTKVVMCEATGVPTYLNPSTAGEPQYSVGFELTSIF